MSAATSCRSSVVVGRPVRVSRSQTEPPGGNSSFIEIQCATALDDLVQIPDLRISDLQWVKAEGGHDMDLPAEMVAMVYERPLQPLRLRTLPVPIPGAGEVLIRVAACGVCRTDLHLVDGELPDTSLPIIPGHEVVGTVVATGDRADRFQIGDRVGVPWLGWTCGSCRFCLMGRENLCDEARFTGYTINGGYSQYAVADQRFCFRLPPGYSDLEAAPLLCAGLIGYRAYRLCGTEIEHLGIYGFGAAAHIVAQIAVHQGRTVSAFTRPGDTTAQRFALRLGASWAGDSTATPPHELDAAIIFAPVGSLVPAALRALRKGGRVVCGGIHMSDIPSFPYSLLWQEREVVSVANLERRDAEELLAIAPEVPVRTEVEPVPLERANEALERLRAGELTGAAVLAMPG
jgi:propanol-preferring alcohol dehydrogenase